VEATRVGRVVDLFRVEDLGAVMNGVGAVRCHLERRLFCVCVCVLLCVVLCVVVVLCCVVLCCVVLFCVVIVNDDEENIPSIRGHIVKEDVERRLQQFQTVISSYKNRLKSSEHLNNSLHKYLRQTQGYAENLLSERQELIDIINEMEKEDTRRVDQELLLKFIMCSSLFLYFFGGSHQFLVATVVLQLIVTAVNIIV
jgi:conjugal transfer/entry exclusion protein